MAAESIIGALGAFFHPIIEVLITLVHHYGLIGLFVSAFLGSTIFIPFSVEIAISILVNERIDPYLIVLVATVGALMGTWVNYGIGYYASELAQRKLGEKNIKKAKDAMDKWGWPGLFLIVMLPTPIPVDPLTIIPGITRMNFLEFSIIIFFAKLIRYALLIGLLEGILNVMPSII